MQITTRKIGSQPWWIILLLIPMLVSCVSPVVFWEVALSVGAELAYSQIGQFIEQVIDNLVEKAFNDESPGYVIEDPNNPLQGTYSTKMRFTTIDRGQRRSFEVTKPRMFRDSESSPWQLAPDIKELVAQILKGGY